MSLCYAARPPPSVIHICQRHCPLMIATFRHTTDRDIYHRQTAIILPMPQRYLSAAKQVFRRAAAAAPCCRLLLYASSLKRAKRLPQRLRANTVSFTIPHAPWLPRRCAPAAIITPG